MISIIRNIVYYTILILLINLVIRSSFRNERSDLSEKYILTVENEQSNKEDVTLIQSYN